MRCFLAMRLASFSRKKVALARCSRGGTSMCAERLCCAVHSGDCCLRDGSLYFCNRLYFIWSLVNAARFLKSARSLRPAQKNGDHKSITAKPLLTPPGAPLTRTRTLVMQPEYCGSFCAHPKLKPCRFALGPKNVHQEVLKSIYSLGGYEGSGRERSGA